MFSGPAVCGEMWRAVVLLCGALAAVEVRPQDVPRADVYSLRVTSEVRNRYARTVVSSRVANRANVSQEVSFDAVLPETAFIAGFVIEMDGQSYSAYVRGKEEAKQEYQQAVSSGRGAAHVEASVRDSNVVSVSVNVEPQKKVTFNLTYEELLSRQLSAYNLRINLDPRQLVEDLSVEVVINETSPITTLRVPSLQESNEVDEQPDQSDNPLADVQRPSPTTATVRWAPTREQQRQLRADGVRGQLVVSYDVNHTAHPDQVLVSEDGYFVHFFFPADLPPMPKHAVFVLDTSGSMMGRKIEQLKTAMLTILDELNEGDSFSLVPFSSWVQVWQPGTTLDFSWSSPHSLEPQFNESAVVAATKANVEEAKNSVKGFVADGGTFMHRALSVGLRLCEAGRLSGGRRASLLVLLTDGQPNGELSDPDEIVRRVSASNAEFRASLFTLAFGEGADFRFLRQLALRNGGFGRRIYEAADAHLQLREFYRQIASPLLSDVNFTYAEGQVDEQSLTQATFPVLFRGGELVVAGRLASAANASGSLQAAVCGGGLPPLTPAAAVERVSSAERLWAFLTVRQLLDRDAASPNDTVKQQARRLALKYSFVTPLTSLVVVKPNETSLVDPAEARPGMEIGDAIMPLSLSAPGGYMGYSARSFVRRPVAPIMPGMPAAFYHTRARPLHLPPLPAVVRQSAVQGRAEHDAVESAVVSSTVAGTVEQLALLSDVTWLDGVLNGTEVNLSINGSNVSLTLASNQTEGQFSSCSTPLQQAGHCVHFARCPLRSFADSLDAFLAGYFCTAADSFLGTCCPDDIALTPTAAR